MQTERTWPEKVSGKVRTSVDAVFERHPVLTTWPDDEKLIVAEQPAYVGHVLVAEYHQEIFKANIAYLFREDMSSRGASVWGKAAKASAKLKLLSEYDFTIDFNWKVWRELQPMQRVALVDHELAHCTMNDKGNFVLCHHDVAEFHEIIDRWGLWSLSLQEFADVMRPQLEMQLAEV